MPSEPLIQWADPVKEFIGFVALFLGAGAIGFRYFAPPVGAVFGLVALLIGVAALRWTLAG